MTQRLVLGPAVRAIREAKQMKGSVLCIQAGISHGYLVNIEKGARQPSPEVAEALAAALGVDIKAFTYEVPDMRAAS
jgi:transcriptional regulator with XRE-family HTH domain